MTARLAPTRNASACMGCGYWRDGTPAPLRGATVTSTLPSASVARSAAPGRGWGTPGPRPAGRCRPAARPRATTPGGGPAVRGEGGGVGAARHVAPGAAAVAAAVGSGALAAFAQAAAFSAARHGACAGPG